MWSEVHVWLKKQKIWEYFYEAFVTPNMRVADVQPPFASQWVSLDASIILLNSSCVWIDTGILLQNYGDVSNNVHLQCQSTGQTSVSTEHEVSEQRPHGLPVVQIDGIHPGTFYNWVRRLRKKLLRNPRADFKGIPYTTCCAGSGQAGPDPNFYMLGDISVLTTFASPEERLICESPLIDCAVS